jgi:SET domain-containing protein
VKRLPHVNVYTRLRPSKIHGVGVFAIRKIKKGTSIFPDEKKKNIRWVRKHNLRGLPRELRKLYDDFSIIKDNHETYGCPSSFNQLSLAWFLNKPQTHKKPNVCCRNDYMFYALRDIAVGEELTVDYRTFSEEPDSSASEDQRRT